MSLQWIGVIVLGVVAYMVAGYVLALKLRDNSIADIAWGPGFVLAAVLAAAARGELTTPAALVLALVALWGGRLAWHIASRHRGEDPRYAAWRDRWRWVKLRSFVQVWMLQAAIMLLVVAPVLIIVLRARRLGVWPVAGGLVALAGLAIETLADAQVSAWRRAGGHGLFTGGLWRYSRHPNYFGDALVWWGLWLMALGVPWGWATIFSPLLMTFLLRFVSGVPLTERRYEGRAGWAEYKRRTNAFVPWLPRPDPAPRG